MKDSDPFVGAKDQQESIEYAFRKEHDPIWQVITEAKVQHPTPGNQNEVSYRLGKKFFDTYISFLAYVDKLSDEKFRDVFEIRTDSKADATAQKPKKVDFEVIVNGDLLDRLAAEDSASYLRIKTLKGDIERNLVSTRYAFQGEYAALAQRVKARFEKVSLKQSSAETPLLIKEAIQKEFGVAVIFTSNAELDAQKIFLAQLREALRMMSGDDSKSIKSCAIYALDHGSKPYIQRNGAHIEIPVFDTPSEMAQAIHQLLPQLLEKRTLSDEVNKEIQESLQVAYPETRFVLSNYAERDVVLKNLPVLREALAMIGNDRLRENVSVLIKTGGGVRWIKAQKDGGLNTIELDVTTPLPKIREFVIALFGEVANQEPQVGTQGAIDPATQAWVESMRARGMKVKIKAPTTAPHEQTKTVSEERLSAETPLDTLADLQDELAERAASESETSDIEDLVGEPEPLDYGPTVENFAQRIVGLEPVGDEMQALPENTRQQIAKRVAEMHREKRRVVGQGGERVKTPDEQREELEQEQTRQEDEAIRSAISTIIDFPNFRDAITQIRMPLRRQNVEDDVLDSLWRNTYAIGNCAAGGQKPGTGEVIDELLGSLPENFGIRQQATRLAQQGYEAWVTAGKYINFDDWEDPISEEQREQISTRVNEALALAGIERGDLQVFIYNSSRPYYVSSSGKLYISKDCSVEEYAHVFAAAKDIARESRKNSVALERHFAMLKGYYPEVNIFLDWNRNNADIVAFLDNMSKIGNILGQMHAQLAGRTVTIGASMYQNKDGKLFIDVMLSEAEIVAFLERELQNQPPAETPAAVAENRTLASLVNQEFARQEEIVAEATRSQARTVPASFEVEARADAMRKHDPVYKLLKEMGLDPDEVRFTYHVVTGRAIEGDDSSSLVTKPAQSYHQMLRLRTSTNAQERRELDEKLFGLNTHLKVNFTANEKLLWGPLNDKEHPLHAYRYRFYGLLDRIRAEQLPDEYATWVKTVGEKEAQSKQEAERVKERAFVEAIATAQLHPDAFSPLMDLHDALGKLGTFRSGGKEYAVHTLIERMDGFLERAKRGEMPSNEELKGIPRGDYNYEGGPNLHDRVADFLRQVAVAATFRTPPKLVTPPAPRPPERPQTSPAPWSEDHVIVVKRKRGPEGTKKPRAVKKIGFADSANPEESTQPKGGSFWKTLFRR